MKTEKRILFDDVMGDAARREATLMAGGRVLRRRRLQRVLARSIAALAAAALGALAIHSHSPSARVAQAVAPKPESETVHVENLTDDELLAQFPGIPVGIIKTADGKKHLIFPRPGDEEKFVIRL